MAAFRASCGGSASSGSRLWVWLQEDTTGAAGIPHERAVEVSSERLDRAVAEAVLWLVDQTDVKHKQSASARERQRKIRANLQKAIFITYGSSDAKVD